MRKLFISDLHLYDKRPNLIRAFILFTDALIEQNFAKPSELYILGDLYESWVGDDADLEWNLAILEAFHRLHDVDIPVFFIHGNRDFLIGPQWSKETHAILLNEISVVNHKDQRILLAHGDELCTNDKEYQTFRTMVRSRAWQSTFLEQSAEHRLQIAQELRENSRNSSHKKSPKIMDIVDKSLNETLIKFDSQMIIHGHTHKPALHQDDDHCRLVLGDWDKMAWLAVLEKDHLVQYQIPIEKLNTISDWAIEKLTLVHEFHF